MNRIPIRFLDADGKKDTSENTEPDDVETMERDNDEESFDDPDVELLPVDTEEGTEEFSRSGQGLEADPGAATWGPEMAELVATRSELKRVEAESAELKDRVARRQAEFENYRKRVDRERSETYNHVVADVATKLLPVLDNLKRALDTEASVESSESDEFRHFLSGVDLIYKQLKGVIEGLGVKPIPSVGELFDPHLHEAVVTEATDEYEPDTVMQELVAGYRLGDKLIRPAMVKVAKRS
jgi:molecular chaperone GrpE